MPADGVHYRVHRLDIKMTQDQSKLERFVVPNVSLWFYWVHRVDFLLVIEKVAV